MMGRVDDDGWSEATAASGEPLVVATFDRQFHNGHKYLKIQFNTTFIAEGLHRAAIKVMLTK
jgi:hypothetical protein